jgi:RimJ/RimL family protein N-acetyltransferase
MRTETPRLLLREWRLSDFEPYADYYADPALARYVGGHLGREAAWRHMATHAGHWALLGYGYWAVEEKASSDLVGGVGLWHSDGWPELELGYWLMPEKQGKGYATEAGKRALDYAWEDVGAQSLVSYIDPRNEASRRVAERLGATFESMAPLLDFGDHCVYRYHKP